MVRELKHTEIGDIPVDWELQTFDETFRVISNNTLSRENLNNCGGAVRNIHYGDILTKFPEVLDCNEEEIPYINELSLLSSSTQLLQDGDIVVADTAEDETVGKVIEVQNLGDSKLVAGLHTIPCRVKKGDFAPGWLGYYMNSDLFHNQILPYITGIKVSSISKGAISETLILVPPFDEQEKIVQSLNKIQLLMTAETKVVNKIKLVKNGCLSKMFPQKDDTVPEMRLPGFTEAWEQRKLGELEKDATLYMGRGRVISAKDMSNTPGTFPVYSSSALDNGRMGAYGKYMFNQELITWSIDGGGAVFYRRKHRFSVTNVSGYIAVNPEKINCKFLAYAMSLAHSRIKFDYTVKAHPSVIRSLYTMGIPISLQEQQVIGSFFSRLDNLITLHQRKLELLRNIKKSLLDKMFV